MRRKGLITELLTFAPRAEYLGRRGSHRLQDKRVLLSSESHFEVDLCEVKALIMLVTGLILSAECETYFWS